MEAERGLRGLSDTKLKEKTLFLMLPHCHTKFSSRSMHAPPPHTCTLIPDHLYALDKDRHRFNSLIASCSTGRAMNFVMEGKRMLFPSLKESQSYPQGPSFAMDSPPPGWRLGVDNLVHARFLRVMPVPTALQATKPGKCHKSQREFFRKWGVTQAAPPRLSDQKIRI